MNAGEHRMQLRDHPIGTRRRSALELKQRSAERDRKAWLAQIPHDPWVLVTALREAGVDLDELREALR